MLLGFRRRAFPTVLLAVSCSACSIAPAEKPKPEAEDPRVPVAKTTVWKDGNTWQKVHESHVARAKKGDVNLVFFGDSITQWWPWKDFKARYQPLGAVNFGIGGDKVQNLLWRIRNGEMNGITPKVAVVLIGTNNLGDDVTLLPEGIAHVVNAIREKSPTTKVLLLGIFPRGWNQQEFAYLRPKIAKINATIAKLDDGNKVRYADLGPKILEPDGTLPRKIAQDGLHLAPEGYRRWADAMRPFLQEMMGLPASAFPTVTLPAAPAESAPPAAGKK